MKVYATENTQALLYALGFFFEYDWLYNFQTIEIRIAQPRIDDGHFDVWTVSREYLLAFAERGRCGGPRHGTPRLPASPGWWCDKGFCKVRAECPALAAFAADVADEMFDDLDDEDVQLDENGAILAQYTVQDMAVAADQAVTARDYNLRVARRPWPTEAMARIYRHRRLFENWFRLMGEELYARAMNGEEIPGFKLVDGREGDSKYFSQIAALKLLQENGVDLLDALTTEVISAERREGPRVKPLASRSAKPQNC